MGRRKEIIHMGRNNGEYGPSKGLTPGGEKYEGKRFKDGTAGEEYGPFKKYLAVAKWVLRECTAGQKYKGRRFEDPTAGEEKYEDDPTASPEHIENLRRAQAENLATGENHTTGRLYDLEQLKKHGILVTPRGYLDRNR